MINGLLPSLFAPVSVIGMAHVFAGTAVLWAPEAAKVSALAGPMGTGVSPPAIAVTLLTVGILAIGSRISTLSANARLALTVPQQLFLLVQLYGVIVAIWIGGYPDGYIPVPGNHAASAWFIFGDQAALIAMCLSHTFEVVFMRALPREHHLEKQLKVAQEDYESCQRYLSMLHETRFWEKTLWENDKGEKAL